MAKSETKGDTPDLSEEEDALLDEVWRKLEEEENK